MTKKAMLKASALREYRKDWQRHSNIVLQSLKQKREAAIEQQKRWRTRRRELAVASRFLTWSFKPKRYRHIARRLLGVFDAARGATRHDLCALTKEAIITEPGKRTVDPATPDLCPDCFEKFLPILMGAQP